MVFEVENDKKFKSYLAPKYKLIYKIGTASGLRVSDIIKLKKIQVQSNNRPSIKAKKTGKVRRIFISQKTRELINDIIRADMTGSEYLFPSPRDPKKHITRQSVYKAFQKASLIAGIDHKIGTHCMRKKYAKKQFKKVHGDIFKVQKMLQHEKIGDTATYLIGAPKK